MKTETLNSFAMRVCKSQGNQMEGFQPIDVFSMVHKPKTWIVSTCGTEIPRSCDDFFLGCTFLFWKKFSPIVVSFSFLNLNRGCVQNPKCFGRFRATFPSSGDF